MQTAGDRRARAPYLVKASRAPHAALTTVGSVSCMRYNSARNRLGICVVKSTLAAVAVAVAVGKGRTSAHAHLGSSALGAGACGPTWNQRKRRPGTRKRSGGRTLRQPRRPQRGWGPSPVRDIAASAAGVCASTASARNTRAYRRRSGRAPADPPRVAGPCHRLIGGPRQARTAEGRSHGARQLGRPRVVVARQRGRWRRPCTDSKRTRIVASTASRSVALPVRPNETRSVTMVDWYRLSARPANGTRVARAVVHSGTPSQPCGWCAAASVAIAIVLPSYPWNGILAFGFAGGHVAQQLFHQDWEDDVAAH